ncbi:hypothetical protein DRJ04_05265 [Candidatus Aerophobetes bacterium]|uniref:DUF2062 domain-containing protein n=1 Tax=Aerophobetes bacterium TaxID=2030807 RepID=A0A662DDH0_UNCAE|nr:MAG: hypothetical protein DRJ04_05265 [Candidatus Aerophobetes bacterium]
MSKKRPVHRKNYWLKIKILLKKALLANDSPERLARGFAIGVFWGVLPTFGLAILFSLPTAVLFKANRLTAFLGTFISNPFTSPFFMLWGTYLGNFILRTTPIVFSWKILNIEQLLKISKSLLVGTLILAASMAVLSYGTLLVVIPLVKKLYHRRKDFSRDSLEDIF